MKIYRLVRKEYLRWPPGEGARRFGGRWNSEGMPVIYASESKALAMLEILANVRMDAKSLYSVITFAIPENLKIKRVTLKELKKNWNAFEQRAHTRRLGDEWLTSCQSSVLAVPSAIILDARNYLINPAHKDFTKITVSPPEKFAFDPRLVK